MPVVAIFSSTVQARPRAHPASYTMGTGLYPGVKRMGCGVNDPPPYSAEVKERVDTYLSSPSGPIWPVLGRNLTLLTNIQYQLLIKFLRQTMRKYDCVEKSADEYEWRVSR